MTKDKNNAHPLRRAWRAAMTQMRTGRAWRELWRRCPRAAAAAEAIPPHIRDRWLAEAQLEIPGWCPDPAQWVLCSGALMQFFDACRVKRAATGCALPSRAADSVWHLWLRIDPEGLRDWQIEHFGAVCPHVEAADFDSSFEEALVQSWAAACRSEGHSPLTRCLPLMFELDRRLRVPGGWAYRCSPLRHQLVHREIDASGRAAGTPHLHQRVAYVGLAALGLLTQREAASWEREQATRRSDGGGGCGSTGSSCGCSCGSSCGGGCGS